MPHRSFRQVWYDPMKRRGKSRFVRNPTGPWSAGEREGYALSILSARDKLLRAASFLAPQAPQQKRLVKVAGWLWRGSIWDSQPYSQQRRRRK